MLLESIVINIVKKGFGVKPSYSLKVKGDGKVVYEGFENVKVEGLTESFLEDEEVVSIMSSFKDSGFFSVDKDSFVVDDSSTRPFTSIKVEMPGENNINKSKTINYYDDDPSAPLNLKNFEKKVIELTGADKWITKDVQKPAKSNSDTKIKNNKKMFKVVAAVSICILLSMCLVFFMFLNTDILPDDETPDVVYDPPKILSLSSAKAISDNIPVNSYVFEVGNQIYIYFKYSNITHDDIYMFSGEVNLYYEDNLVDNYVFNVNSSEDFVNSCVFLSQESWPLGEYRVAFNLKDEISNLSTSLETFFNLYDKTPKINIFIPSDVEPSYEVYNISYIFNLGDTIFLYTEYNGINTTDNNTKCNLLLEINITDYYDNVYWFYSENKTTVGNNAHSWWFSTNSSWTASLYIANLYLYDYNTGLDDTSTTYISVFF